mmetsp:Transcript_10016/g.10332  ORF Transcript_10016/g.10332 Transcript_10016/m.10332 type:complete len:331 (+) Transcript_10016:1-993(+)
MDKLEKKLKKSAYRDIVIPNFSTMEEYQDFLNDLQSKKQEEVNKGSYVEAEELRLKILETKNYFTNEKKEMFKNKQHKEVDNVHSEYSQIMNDFNNKWKKVFFEFETKSNLATEKLLKKNQEEMRTLSDIIDKEAANIKFSSYYDKIVEMENKLVVKERYLEAQKIRNRVEKVKDGEIQKYLKDQVIKYNTQVSKLNKLHDNEMKNLKKKIEEERINLERERVKELHDIDFTFKSKKIEVEVKQRHDKKKFEVEIKSEGAAVEKNLTSSGAMNINKGNTITSNSNNAQQRASFTMNEANSLTNNIESFNVNNNGNAMGSTNNLVGIKKGK